MKNDVEKINFFSFSGGFGFKNIYLAVGEVDCFFGVDRRDGTSAIININPVLNAIIS